MNEIQEMKNMLKAMIDMLDEIKSRRMKMGFGEALEAMRAGEAVRRKGWNGIGIFIALQRPDEKSKMTQPYIYIDTTGLVSNNPDAPRGKVPWLASQTDLLAEDWEIAREVENGED